VFVNNVAQLLDAILKYSVRAWVGHHATRQIIGVKRCLGAQIGKINIALTVAINGNNVHARNNRACWICSVRTFWNQADIAMALSALLVIRVNDH